MRSAELTSAGAGLAAWRVGVQRLGEIHKTRQEEVPDSTEAFFT